MDALGLLVFGTFILSWALYSIGLFLPLWLTGKDVQIGLWQKFLPMGYHPNLDIGSTMLLTVTRVLVCLGMAGQAIAFLSDIKWRCSSVSYTMSYPRQAIGTFTTLAGVFGASGVIVFSQDTQLYHRKSLDYGVGFILCSISSVILIGLGFAMCCRKSAARTTYYDSEPDGCGELAPQNTTDTSPDAVEVECVERPRPLPRSRSQTPSSPLRSRPTPPPRPRPKPKPQVPTSPETQLQTQPHVDRESEQQPEQQSSPQSEPQVPSAPQTPSDLRPPLKPRRPAPDVPPPAYATVEKAPDAL